MFLFRHSKKELDIRDALAKKRATITIGGQPVVIEAFKLSRALDLMGALGGAPEMLKSAAKDTASFNRFLLSKLPEILAFCAPGMHLDPDKITFAEFADLLLAVWCVNDLDRVISNFTQAVQSMPKLTQVLASSPKS